MTIQVTKAAAGYDLTIDGSLCAINLTRAHAMLIAAERTPDNAKDYVVKKLSERLNRTRGHEATVTV